MRKSKDVVLREAMLRHGVSLGTANVILADVFGAAAVTQRRRLDASDETFDGIQASVRAARRSLISNKSKWVPELVPLYEEYLELLDAVVRDVEQCRAVMVKNPADPDGPRLPATPADIARLSAKQNRKAKEAGQPLGPARTHVWTSWVAPAEVERMVEAFDTAYTVMRRGKGQRFYPFVTTQTRSAMRSIIRVHRQFIDHQRDAILSANTPDEHGRISNCYGALHLTALRQAELWLDGYEKNVKDKHAHPALNLVPVNWTHMLAADLRARLKAADENPAAVTPEGLTSYLRQD